MPLPRGIVGTHGLGRRQRHAEKLAVVGSKSFLMVNAGEMECQREGLQGIALDLGEVSGVVHLFKHYVPPSARPVVVADRVEVGRVLAHAYEGGDFFRLQGLGCPPEIYTGGRFDANGVIEEVKLVEVHIDNLLLRVKPFETDGYHPFNRLLEDTFKHIFRAGREKLFGKLLGNGTPAAAAFLHQYAALYHGTQQAQHINAAVIGKADVFRGNQGFDKVGGKVFIRHIDTVVHAVGIAAEYLPVRRDDLRSVFVYRVLQLLNRRHIAYRPVGDCRKHQCHRHKNRHKQRPNGYDNTFSYLRSHFGGVRRLELEIGR
ncbi:hypothetical protein Barb7_02866 [Bacteroidales bacterium Barb7]|nr:hypothetical protein Barb7_02866 [Bacteroidales bacterium Barb7]